MTRFKSRCLVIVTLAGWLSTLSGCSFLRQAKNDEMAMARQVSLRGEQALRQGHWLHAEQLYGRAIQHAPSDHRAQRGYAEALWNQRAHDTAISHMEKSLKFSGQDPKVMVRLGEMYLEKGYLPQSKHCAEQAIATDHMLPSGWALKGKALFRAGDLYGALGGFHRALSLQSQLPGVQLEMAQVYRMQQRPRRALATLDVLARTYERRDIPQEVLYLHGLALKDIGRYEESADQLAQAVKQGQPNAKLLFELSESQWLAGNPANARLSLLEALSLSPDHHPSRQLLARIEDNRQGLTANISR